MRVNEIYYKSQILLMFLSHETDGVATPSLLPLVQNDQWRPHVNNRHSWHFSCGPDGTARAYEVSRQDANVRHLHNWHLPTQHHNSSLAKMDLPWDPIDVLQFIGYHLKIKTSRYSPIIASNYRGTHEIVIVDHFGKSQVTSWKNLFYFVMRTSNLH